MAKSSINFQKASAHSYEHNFRKDKPNYLLPKEFQLKNEFWQHEKSDQEIFSEELSKANRKGGRKPKLENSRWEAVLNLNKNHTLEDVEEVAKHIEKKFNIICTRMALHRDEGFIENDKPNYNIHAHLEFITYKDGRQNWRKEHIKPSTLSELQTEVAELLQMERGQINSKAERLSHKQYKQKAKELAKQKDLKAEIKQLREALQAQGAVREDYAQLEALNRELKEQIKAKDLTIEQLKNKLESKTLYKNFYEKNYEKKKKQLSEARETILNLKTTIDTQKDDLERYEQNMSDLEHKNKELRDKVSKLEKENDELKLENYSLNAERSDKERALQAQLDEISESIDKLLPNDYEGKISIGYQSGLAVERFKVFTEFATEQIKQRNKLEKELRTYRGGNRQEKRKELNAANSETKKLQEALVKIEELENQIVVLTEEKNRAVKKAEIANTMLRQSKSENYEEIYSGIAP